MSTYLATPARDWRLMEVVPALPENEGQTAQIHVRSTQCPDLTGWAHHYRVDVAPAPGWAGASFLTFDRRVAQTLANLFAEGLVGLTPPAERL